MLLVLDLDETLVFATDKPIGVEPAHRVFDYDIHWRPGLQTFVRHVSRLFRLAVWTSSSGDYADAVCDPIFRDVAQLEFIWARDRCTRKFDYDIQEPYYAKRLSKLRKYGYDLERMLVVDDTPEKHGKNYGNLITVKSFEGDRNDDELVLLGAYVEELAAVPGDVRKPEKRGWRRRLASASAADEKESAQAHQELERIRADDELYLALTSAFPSTITALRWWVTPSRLLKGQSPRDAHDAGERQLVLNELAAIRHGFPA